MKDYYSLFVELSLQQCTKNDYTNKKKVKVHNTSFKKLQRLQEEMQKTDCINILSMLLLHNDNRVKLNAASLCLKMGVLVDKAVLTLKNIIDSSDDSTICFSAKMILQSIS